jgi:hypothetical protein
VAPHAPGQLLQLALVKSSARGGGEFVGGVDDEELKGAAVLPNCPRAGWEVRAGWSGTALAVRSEFVRLACASAGSGSASASVCSAMAAGVLMAERIKADVR